MGEQTVDTLVRRTQVDGKGVKNHGGNLKKLKSLEPSTIKRRQRFRQLSGKTSPATSNLTMTGKLIDSISFKVLRTNKVQIFLKGTRNKKIGSYVSNVRPFLHLSRGEIRNLNTFFKKLIGRL